MDGPNLLKSEALSSLRLGDIHTNDQQTLITSSATDMHSQNFYSTPSTSHGPGLCKPRCPQSSHCWEAQGI